MKKLIYASLIVSLAFVFSLAFPTVEADKFPFEGEYETYYRDVDDDEMVGLLIKYIGSEENGQVDGNATGDILLLEGDLGSEAAITDTTNCGAVAGTLDVSDADCDTFGELMAECNSLTDWICTIVDVPPWVDSGASALILLDPGSAQDAKTDSGYAMLVDTTALDDTFVALLPNSRYGANDMRTFTKGVGATTLQDQASQYKNTVSYLEHISFIFGDADTGTSTLEFVTVDMRNITSNNYEGVAENIAYVRLEATDDTWTNRDFLDAPYPFPEGHRVWVSLAQAGDTADATNHFLITYTIGQKEN